MSLPIPAAVSAAVLSVVVLPLGGAPGSAAPLTPGAPTLSGSTVSWPDRSTTEHGFVIERCEGLACTAYARVGWVPRNVTSFVDPARPTSIAAASYRVRSFDASGFSEPSPSVTWTRGLGVAIYIEPPRLAVDPSDPNLVHADGSLTVPLRYRDDGSGHLVAFQPPVSWVAGDGSAATTQTPRWDLSFDVGGAYSVSARASDGLMGTGSAQVTVPGNPVTKPVALVAAPSRTSVRLTWVSFPTAATAIEVWRCPGTDSCTAPARKVSTLGRNAGATTVGSLSAGKAYRLWLRAVRSGDQASAMSQVLVVTTLR